MNLSPLLFRFSFFIFIIIGFASCRQVLYFPDRANTPGLTKALEAKATISAIPRSESESRGSSSNSSGYSSTVTKRGGSGTSIDLAFSPIEHLGIIGSYRWLNTNSVSNFQSSSGSGTDVTDINGGRWELGCGYYDNLGAKGFVEIYGGASNGYLKQTSNGASIETFDTKYFRPFIQPAFGVKANNFFQFSGGFRTSLVRFYSFESPNPDLRYEIGNANIDVEKTNYLFFEPFCNFEGGYKFIKGNIQVGASQQLNNARITQDVPFYISFGLTFHFLPEYFK